MVDDASIDVEAVRIKAYTNMKVLLLLYEIFKIGKYRSSWKAFSSHESRKYFMS